MERDVGPHSEEMFPLAAAQGSPSRPDVGFEPPSFEAVYAEHFAFIWRSARRLGIPDGAVEDVVQEILVVIHKRLPTFEGRSSLKTWIFGVILRVVRDQRQALARAAARSHGVDPDALGDGRLIPDEQLTQKEAAQVLHRVLGSLDDEKRAVFVMAELEQMSAPEISEALGVNINTVYSRLRAARQEFEVAAARLRMRDGWRLR